jgi:hypothetical protein
MWFCFNDSCPAKAGGSVIPCSAGKTFDYSDEKAE